MGMLMVYDADHVFQKMVLLNKRIIVLMVIGIVSILYLTLWGLARSQQIASKHLTILRKNLPAFLRGKKEKNGTYTFDKIPTMTCCFSQQASSASFLDYFYEELNLLLALYYLLQYPN